LPTYTYTCISCNDLIERRQSFSDPPLTTCEQCGGSLRKVFHPVGIVFKGSGWYVTDSRSSSSSSGANGTSPKSDTDKKSDSSSSATSSQPTTSTAAAGKD
jgi:putative FmdB family regulatory protein